MDIDKLKEAASNYRQEFVDSNIRFEDIDYAEENYEAGRLEGVSISAEEAFIAGAKWALENQWRDARKELPEDNEQVIGRYFIGCEDHNCHDDKIVYSQDNGENWFTDFGGIAFDIGKPDMWMPIPNLHEELK